ncbi:hypothetical protein D3C81_1630740 [compost metagenome]
MKKRKPAAVRVLFWMHDGTAAVYAVRTDSSKAEWASRKAEIEADFERVKAEHAERVRRGEIPPPVRPLYWVPLFR